MKSFLTILIITFFSAAAFAQAAGDLDNSFGTAGKVADGFPNGGFYGNISCVVVQLDGKILIAGTMKLSGLNNYQNFVSRYNTDGSLDSSFGGSGTIMIGGETSCVVFALTVQQDWKIIVAQFTDPIYSVMRFNQDGSYDTSFLIINSYYFFSMDLAVALQSDSKILIGGDPSPNSEFRIARYNSDATLDTSFNGTGIVTTSIGLESGITSIAIQSDGKILATGYADTGASYVGVIARYKPSGSLDSSFSQDGIATTLTGSGRIAIQSDGKILMNGAGYGLTLVRYNVDGTVDSTFGSYGVASIDSFYAASSFAIQADGKIIATVSPPVYHSDFVIICLNEDGTVDTSFGSNGITTTDFDDNSDFAQCVGIEPDRKIVVAGDCYGLIELARYLSELNIGILNFSPSQSSPLIYPNPIHQTETLEYTLTKNETLSIALYDVNGKLVQSFFTNESRTAGKHKELLNLNENLPTGNYLLSLTNGVHNISVKLVKQ